MKERDKLVEINLLKSLFVSSSENDKLVLPAEKEYLLEELVLGTLDYIDGPQIARKREFKSEKAKTIFHNNLDNRIEWLKNPIGLDSDIGITLYELVHSYKENCSPDSLNTPFYDLFRNEFEREFLQLSDAGISTVPPQVISYIKEIIMPSFKQKQQVDIFGIGNCMKPYIIEDLEYLSGRK